MRSCRAAGPYFFAGGFGSFEKLRKTMSGEEVLCCEKLVVRPIQTSVAFAEAEGHERALPASAGPRARARQSVTTSLLNSVTYIERSMRRRVCRRSQAGQAVTSSTIRFSSTPSSFSTPFEPSLNAIAKDNRLAGSKTISLHVHHRPRAILLDRTERGRTSHRPSMPRWRGRHWPGAPVAILRVEHEQLIASGRLPSFHSCTRCSPFSTRSPTRKVVSAGRQKVGKV